MYRCTAYSPFAVVAFVAAVAFTLAHRRNLVLGHVAGSQNSGVEEYLGNNKIQHTHNWSRAYA